MKPLSEEERARIREANRQRARLETRKPGAETGTAPTIRATTRHQAAPAIGPHQRSLIALGMTPEQARAQVRHQAKGDKTRMKGKRSLGSDGGLAVRIMAHQETQYRPADPADANGKHPPHLKEWPGRNECCWPTSEGAPWTFCRHQVAPGTRYGYCAEHESKTRSRAAGGTGTIEAADLGARAPSVTPPSMAKNGHHGANKSFNGRARSIRRAAQ